MNKSCKILLVGCLLSFAAGCAAAYTNIEHVGEDKYRITEMKQGIFRIEGVLLECIGSGATMKCKEIAIE
jgi:hypothetical protein